MKNSNKPNDTTVKFIDDELWDYYSGLPNPMWYQYVNELEDTEEDDIISDNIDTVININKQ